MVVIAIIGIGEILFMACVNGVNQLGAVERYFYLNRRDSECSNSIPATNRLNAHF